MKNKNNMENKFFKHLFENKRLVLTLEVVLLVMSLFVMIVGRIYQWDSVLIAIMDGIFTAMLLAVITTIINWNVQSNYEEIISQLKEDNNLLSQTTEQFKTMIDSSVNKLQHSTDINQHVLGTFLGRNCLFCKTVLLNVYPDRQAAKLDEFFATAKREICVLVTNLESIKEHTPLLIEKAQQGVAVKLCTIDPRAASAFNITRVTGGTSNPRTRFVSMQAALEGFLERNMKLFEDVAPEQRAFEQHDKANSLQIRTYSSMPTSIVFISDDECIIGFMLNNAFSRETVHMHFKLEEDSTCCASQRPIKINAFKNHFDQIFNSASSVSEDAVSKWVFTDNAEIITKE